MSFVRYLVERVFQVITTVLLGLIAAFLVFRLLPGDPTFSLLNPRVPAEAIEEIRRRFRLDKPVQEQLILYLINVFKGELGYSFAQTGTLVNEIVLGVRLFNTITLMSLGLLLSATLGTVFGLILGWKSK